MLPPLLVAQTTPATWPQLVLVALAAVAALGACAAAVAAWTVASRGRELLDRTAVLGELEELSRSVRGLAEHRSDLDLRRVEHVLIEIRDANQRLEDVLLRHAEATREALVKGDGSLPAATPGSDGLGERAVNRLLALGYERIQIVTRVEKLAELTARDGEILVEARKDGVLHKGRVLVRSGRISNVELHPAYSIFP
ncbi:MAG: hypothetical protein AAF682_27960 [Planctomycetota bacterium]